MAADASPNEPIVGTAKSIEGAIASTTIGFTYDAFASHATDPDGALVREVEGLVAAGVLELNAMEPIMALMASLAESPTKSISGWYSSLG